MPKYITKLSSHRITKLVTSDYQIIKLPNYLYHMSNPVVVNLKIYNRTYKIKVPPEEESFVRQTAEDINNHIADFQKKYRGRDVQDYFALTMIARMTTARPEAENNDEVVIEELEKISKLIH